MAPLTERKLSPSPVPTPGSSAASASPDPQSTTLAECPIDELLSGKFVDQPLRDTLAECLRKRSIAQELNQLLGDFVKNAQESVRTYNAVLPPDKLIQLADPNDPLELAMAYYRLQHPDLFEK